MNRPKWNKDRTVLFYGTGDGDWLKEIYNKIGPEGILEKVKKTLQGWLDNETQYYESDEWAIHSADEYGEMDSGDRPLE